MKYSKINKVWFEDGRIYVLTEDAIVKSQPLEAFPTLKDASDSQRLDFYIWDNRQSIRWDSIDEDIHISNFDQPEHVNYNNDVNKLLSSFPWLNLAEFANLIGISKSRLDRYRYGIVSPGNQTMAKIKSGLQKIAHDISMAIM